jgi:anti-sigma B factor antagonist
VDLSLDTRNEGDWTVISVGGEIDVYTAPKLVSPWSTW